MVSKAVLMKSGLVSVNTARQVNVAHTKTTVNDARPMSYFSKTTHSIVKRSVHKNTSFKSSNINQRVNIVKDKNVNIVRPKAVVNARPKAVVNAVKGNNVNVVKASARWVWKPKTKVLDHVSKHNSASITLKKAIHKLFTRRSRRCIDSGCSRYMTGNMSYLTDYEDIDGGYVAFGGNLKGGKITRKDHLGKFDGKADEGFFVGYTLNSKAFRVFNSRIRIVEENLHIRFSESTPNVVGSGPDWLFDIDALTRTMNYEPIVAGTQSNGFVDPKSSQDDGSKPSSDDGKKVDEDSRKDREVNVVGEKTSIELPLDPNMPELKDYSIFEDAEDVGAEADMHNLDTTIQVSHILTTRINKDHPLDQVIRDLQSAIQTRKNVKEFGGT
ncbi:putative ribonuclease H-like domain-containing protein [Tanacetum coccineum]